MKKVNITDTKLEGKKLEAFLKAEVSKSAKIKGLFDMGFETKEIAELLGIRYNFAYNVIQNYAFTTGIEFETTRKNTKKDEVCRLFDEGKNNTEVAKELKMNYNYVWKLRKEWEAEVAAEVAKEEQAEVK